MFLAKPLACVSLGVALVVVAHTAWSGVDYLLKFSASLRSST